MTPTPSAPAPRDRARSLWDAFLLGDNERRAEACARAARDEMRALAQEAAERAAVADRLREPHVASALTLYRDAAILYMAAVVAARTGEAPPEPLRGDDVLARFRALVPDDALAGEAAPRAAFLESVRAPDPRAIERLAPPEALAAGQTARAVVRGLGALVEPRGLPEIHFVRRARLVTLAVAAVVLVAWLVPKLMGSPTNLALGKPVTTSGVHPASTSPPSGLTDGETMGSYGVHTTVGNPNPPWVTVDLLAPYLIEAIKVYNRGDGWLTDSLPLTVQLSENGTDYVDVETRTTFFGQLEPWKIALPRRRARYVRVRGVKGKDVVLSELEVFGARP